MIFVVFVFVCIQVESKSMADGFQEQEALFEGKYEIVASFQDQLSKHAETVMAKMIPWDSYHNNNLISSQELQFMVKYDKTDRNNRKNILSQQGTEYSQLFLDLLSKTKKEETIQYVLTLVDQAMMDSSSFVATLLNLGNANPAYPFGPFVRILSRGGFEWFTYAKASSVLSNLLVADKNPPADQLKECFDWIRSKIAIVGTDMETSSALSALQTMLRNDAYRSEYANNQGLSQLDALLKSSVKNNQMTYQILYCFWLLTYNHTIGDRIGTETKAIGTIVSLLSENSKEKVIRLALASLRNLMNIGKNNDQMIAVGIMRPLESLLNRTWGDEDIEEDLNALNDQLQQNLAKLSTFDMYKQEVDSGKLEWSPAHRSERFWKENGVKFEENNCGLLITLKALLSSPDPNVLQIACFDFGEFARLYPRGRMVLRKLDVKAPLMRLLTVRNEEVRKHALLAVQKIMVQHFEYLSQ